MNKLLILLLLVAVVAVAAWAFKQGGDDGFKTVNADEFEKLINGTSAIQVLDVRTQEEYAQGHLPGALLIDVKQTNFLDEANGTLTHDYPVAVYCRSGRRSANAARQLVKAGYVVTNLDGGIFAWQEQGKLVVK